MLLLAQRAPAVVNGGGYTRKWEMVSTTLALALLLYNSVFSVVQPLALAQT